MSKILDYSSYGLGKAAIRFLKVIGYVMLSGAIAAAGAFMADYQIDAANFYQVGLVALVNGVIASIAKWLGSVNPDNVKEV